MSWSGAEGAAGADTEAVSGLRQAVERLALPGARGPEGGCTAGTAAVEGRAVRRQARGAASLLGAARRDGQGALQALQEVDRSDGGVAYRASGQGVSGADWPGACSLQHECGGAG